MSLANIYYHGLMLTVILCILLGPPRDQEDSIAITAVLVTTLWPLGLPWYIVKGRPSIYGLLERKT